MTNDYYTKGNTVYILAYHKERQYIIKIDLKDISTIFLVNSWWIKSSQEGNTLYAIGTLGDTEVLMHRLLLTPEPGLHVHHIDGDGLNNTRDNLQILTHLEHMRAHKPLVNILIKRWYKRYKALIYFEGQKYELGVFNTMEEAIRAKQKFLLTA